MLIDRASDYLEDTLGARLHDVQEYRLPNLAMYLSDIYVLHRAKLLTQTCLLLTLKTGKTVNARAHTRHVEAFRVSTGEDIIVLIADVLDARTARGLIHHRSAFVVPGSQLYLPDFAVHFRSRRPRPRPSGDSLSPTAQLLVLAHLHGRQVDGSTASSLAPAFDLSKMSLSRAVAELRDRDLLELEQQGRENVIRMPPRGRSYWASAQPFLRSPVRKARTVNAAPVMPGSLVAGEAALAHYTLLIEPAHNSYAIPDHRWKSLANLYGPEVGGAPDPSVMEIETWSYDPWLLSPGPAVDRLSLWLAIHDHPDERIGKAAEQMLEEFPF